MKSFVNRLVSTILIAALLLSTGVYAFAANCNEGKENRPPQIVQLFDYVDQISIINRPFSNGPDKYYKEISGEITDTSAIQTLANLGVVEKDTDGTLPKRVVVTQILFTDPEAYSDKEYQEHRGTITVTKSNYYDGQYFDEYDRYVIPGPSSFTQTYSRTSTANWTTNMTGSVTIGGNVYGIADVKAAVSSSMGYTIGSSYTSTSSYQISVPKNKIWTIKVWTSYRVFTYTAKVDSTIIASGKSWYPNGLVIVKTET